MKKLIYIVQFFALTTLLTGCFGDKGTDILITDYTTEGFVEIVEANGGVSRSKTIAVDVDGQNISSSVLLSFGGAVSTEDVTITYSINTSLSTAVEGVDYVLLSPNTITIPAGEYTAPISFEVIDDNLKVSPQLSIVFQIESASVPILEKYASAAIVLDVSCPAPAEIYGMYDVLTTETASDSCTSVTNTVTVSAVEGSTTELQFSDITGGFYANCKTDGADNPGIVIYNCGELIIENQPDTVFKDDVINGLGSYNFETDELVIAWSNGSGDMGTSVYTKQ